MKIGVLTHWTGSDNYGQQLQIYALQKHLKQMGHHAFLIRCIIKNKPPKEQYATIRGIVRFFLRILSKRRRRLYRAAISDKQLCLDNLERNKARRFDEFREQWLEMSDVINSYEELKNNPPQADVYIVGSDQVWNPRIDDENIGAWFLEFGSESIKRISYAASFGRTVHAEEKEKLTTLLENFTAISVREQGALDILHEIGFKSSKLVLDPTLLVKREIYSPFLTDTHQGEPYAFVYYLNIKETKDLAWTQIEAYLHEHHLKLISVTASGYRPAKELIPGHQSSLLTIPDWVDVLHHSSCVITTSFHGLAFAIIMHRPFVAILLNGGDYAANERVLSLLKQLNLSDRVLGEGNSVCSILERAVDWKQVDNLLDKERIRSNIFLRDALDFTL